MDTILAVVQRPLRRVWGLNGNPAWCDWPSPSTVQAIIEFGGAVSGTYLGTSNARGEMFMFWIECAEAALIADDPLDCGQLRLLWGPDHQREAAIPLDEPDTRGLAHHPVASRLPSMRSTPTSGWQDAPSGALSLSG